MSSHWPSVSADSTNTQSAELRPTFPTAGPIIRFCYNQSKKLFKYFAPAQARREQRHNIATAIAHASDFHDICALYGYHAEEHVVQTKDGYLLGLHRLPYRKGEQGTKVNAGEGSTQKRVVYLHHGLLMNSEVWVCLTNEQRCLPFKLVEAGYDVWLGNNRGNKYSKKSTKHSPTTHAFWDFSIDEFAWFDIPDSIDYILDATGQKSLSYIGFSQGTAQAFATLSIHPKLNEKVNVFIALAPAMSPAGLSSGVVDALMKTSPTVVFLAFGRRSILSSTTMWQSILYPPIYLAVIDASLRFLFNWAGRNITAEQKLAAYPHLYSFTSTKSVVHWFQIIRNRSFQMYDDEVQAPLPLMSANSSRYYKPARFPTKNIRTPIVLLYGGSDSLVDINIMLRELPSHTVAKGIPHYEHLDFLWGIDIDKLVFPSVFEALDFYGISDPTAGRGRTALLSMDGPINTRMPQPPPSYADENWTLGQKHPGHTTSSDTDHEGTASHSPRALMAAAGQALRQRSFPLYKDSQQHEEAPASPTPANPAGNGHYAAKLSIQTSNRLTSHSNASPSISPPPPPDQTSSPVPSTTSATIESDKIRSEPKSHTLRFRGDTEPHQRPPSTSGSESEYTGKPKKRVTSVGSIGLKKSGSGISVGKAGTTVGKIA